MEEVKNIYKNAKKNKFITNKRNFNYSENKCY